MIGDRIRKAREYGTYSLDLFSEKLAISKRTLQNYEKNINEPTVNTVINMANLCHIDEWWLLTGKGEMLHTESKESMNLTEKEIEMCDNYRELEEDDQEIFYLELKVAAAKARKKRKD